MHINDINGLKYLIVRKSLHYKNSIYLKKKKSPQLNFNLEMQRNITDMHIYLSMILKGWQMNEQEVFEKELKLVFLLETLKVKGI